MEYPKNLRYSREHEWAKAEGDIVTVGITDYAQDALGDIVFVELPEKGKTVEKGKGAAVVESVKSVSDVYSPVGGTVAEANKKLKETPEMLNKSPYEGGWMFKVKIRDNKDLEELMDAESYEKFVAEQKH